MPRARDVYEQLDDFSMLFTFESGFSAVFATSAHATWLFPFERVEVYGDHASIATEEMERITFATGVDQAALTLDFAQQPRRRALGLHRGGRPLRRCDLRRRRARPSSAAEAFATTELVERCYAAAREASAVRLVAPDRSGTTRPRLDIAIVSAAASRLIGTQAGSHLCSDFRS